MSTAMDFPRIKGVILGMPLHELRFNDVNCLEVVIVRPQLAGFTAVIDDFFGPAVFPSKDKLTQSMLQVVDAYGGIQSGQTLYYLKDASATYIAMLWPWGNGLQITLKIIKVKIDIN